MTPETSIYEFARNGLAVSADKTAIWFYGRSLSYGELFRQIDLVAEHLYALGVRAGTVVTIHLPNCPQAAMAVYATAKLGAICNMVHPLIPADGLKRNMEFAESSIVFTGSHMADIEKFDFGTMVYVDISAFMGMVQGFVYRMKNQQKCPAQAIDFKSLLVPCDTEAVFPEQVALANTCVCYLHSSGTTGSPKTVMHSHKNLNAWVDKTRHYFSGRDIPAQVFLAVVPWFHGLGLVADLHRAISGGSKMVLMAKWDAKMAVNLIKQHKVNLLLGVPSLYRKLLARSEFSGKRIKQLQECFVGGDIVDEDLKAQIDARIGGGRHVSEAYGMTEVVGAAFVMPLELYREGATSYPLKSYCAAVVDDNGNLCYEGTGELVLHADCIMMGYLKDEEATRNALFERDGKLWVRSGDYGRVDKDGYVYFLERLKNIIVHKGYNIYPNEVMNTIRMHADVKDVCVVGVYDPQLDTQIVRACIVPTDGAKTEILEAELRAVCKQQLPAFSVPSQYRFIPVIPTTNVGKVDYKALESIP